MESVTRERDVDVHVLHILEGRLVNVVHLHVRCLHSPPRGPPLEAPAHRWIAPTLRRERRRRLLTSIEPERGRRLAPVRRAHGGGTGRGKPDSGQNGEAIGQRSSLPEGHGAHSLGGHSALEYPHHLSLSSHRYYSRHIMQSTTSSAHLWVQGGQRGHLQRDREPDLGGQRRLGMGSVGPR